MTVARPDPGEALRGLKDFQRATVEYAFRRLYEDTDFTKRFLVADEVGLGKTLVARGVVAKAIDHLWDRVPRIDIVYICSNSEIARQNIRRLQMGGDHVAPPSRITLLPLVLQDLQGKRVNFVAFTPGTSFDLKSSLGIMQERALLYRLLKDAWGLEGAAPLNVLQGYASADNFRAYALDEEQPIDAQLAKAFENALDRHPNLERDFRELCQRFPRTKANIPPEDAELRDRVIGDLRELLAETCLKALDPDLIILDEFQRFKHLLAEDTEESRLAQQLFNYVDDHGDARVLLLSATPYQMYTELDEEDDHYRDFLATLRFLMPGQDLKALQGLLHEYRSELYRLGAGDGAGLKRVKAELEHRLRKVIARTERLAVTEDRNGMLLQVPPSVALAERDVRDYLTLQEVARAVEHSDVLEYWKSAPYLLNFMDRYRFKEDVEEASPEAGRAVAKALTRNPDALLPWKDVQRYREIDPANGRLREMLAQTTGTGAWKLLWVPPSLPYYEPGGAFADPALRGFTKRLVFSSWQVVPKVLAAVVSYDAERRIVRGAGLHVQNTPESRKRRARLLRIATDAEGRLTGLPLFTLLYPSVTLAEEGDPLRLVAAEGTLPSAVDARARVRTRMAELVEGLARGSLATTPEGPVDETWYWAVPVLLDLQRYRASTRKWIDTPDLPKTWAEDSLRDDESGGRHWADHVERLRQVKHAPTGRMPPDLPDVLAQAALASPAVATLRALGRVLGPKRMADPALRTSAAQVAWALRNLFNGPEASALLAGAEDGEPYWRRVLAYCVDGGLQAVLDEYVHVLHDVGMQAKPPEAAAEALGEEVRAALALRAISFGVDEVRVTSSGRLAVEDQRMRAHFAVRLGKERTEDGDETRPDQVRKAFNSPFWPFVLATTSVGQEGLDFHTYCHAVVHWNLPSNPVDLEQREGRVHRFKGHAVRKNIAAAHRQAGLRGAMADPWTAMFDDAAAKAGSSSELVPYWLYPLPAGARIERHVPALPLSRDVERLDRLRRTLVLYRMVFGQSRQEDLVHYLSKRLPDGAERAFDDFRIDLGPPPSG